MKSYANIKITNKYHFSNLCNNYFTSVGSKMGAKISNKDMKFDIPIMLSHSDLILLHHKINQLSISKSSGPENIPIKLCK